MWAQYPKTVHVCSVASSPSWGKTNGRRDRQIIINRDAALRWNYGHKNSWSSIHKQWGCALGRRFYSAHGVSSSTRGSFGAATTRGTRHDTRTTADIFVCDARRLARKPWPNTRQGSARRCRRTSPNHSLLNRLQNIPDLIPLYQHWTQITTHTQHNIHMHTHGWITQIISYKTTKWRLVQSSVLLLALVRQSNNCVLIKLIKHTKYLILLLNYIIFYG